MQGNNKLRLVENRDEEEITTEERLKKKLANKVSQEYQEEDEEQELSEKRSNGEGDSILSDLELDKVNSKIFL
jgi:hypothetical protein